MLTSAHAASTRAYSASARPPRFGPTVSLEHFLLRGKVLALWRRVLRDTRRIGDEATRGETRRLAREEFERQRGVRDVEKIRFLVGTGRTQWGAMEGYINGL